MRVDYANDIVIGSYLGRVADRFNDSDFISQLAILKSLLPVEPGSADVDTVSRVTIPAAEGAVPVAIKAYARRNLIRDAYDRAHGSPARRSWVAARYLRRHGVGTPEPVAFLEKWEGPRLVESYFVAVHEDGITCFRDELIRLYNTDPICSKFMALLESVAIAVKKMHDAGLVHGDLGNQNILLRRTEDDHWTDIHFVDLNRARVLGDVPWKWRAFDISRISLPSDFLRVFKEMYSCELPGPEFERFERLFRRTFALHTRTRLLRHPFRFLPGARQRTDPVYPPEKDMWIWDDRSGQPVSPLTEHDRRRYRHWSGHLKVAAATLSAALPVRRAFSRLMKECYEKPVSISGRLGIALEPDRASLDLQLSIVAELGKVPVMVRLYRHETAEELEFRTEAVRQLCGAGHSVSIALVQDRQAVIEPACWERFVHEALSRVAGHVELAEVGHAINRSKWGIWGPDEHAMLVRTALSAAREYPSVGLIGPAGIDFEYPFVVAALRNFPEKSRLSALSHHLYVDRRGAPENRQGSFSALEKFAIARAIAEWSPVCEGRVIVSEVNWPLKGGGVYSPVGAPYESPGRRTGDPSVTEEQYSDYMIRYLLIAICSGMIDRAYWWRLIARGFGLVDNSDSHSWRKRPAFEAIKWFVSVLGESAFTGRMACGAGVHVFMFQQPDGTRIAVGYSHPENRKADVPFGCGSILDSKGRFAQVAGKAVQFSGSPLYFMDVT